MILLIVSIVIVVFTSGCGSNMTKDMETNNELASGRFTRIYSQDGNEQMILVDLETQVMYYWVHFGSGGGLTVLVNKDGTPMIYNP